jgi:hypothetical protein
MIGLLLLITVLVGSFAIAFAFLPTRAARVVAVVTVAGAAYLWMLPHYYLLDTTGGLGTPSTTAGYVVVNESRTGRNWTFWVPATFGDVRDVGKTSAGLMMICMLTGGLVAWKYRSEKALKA